MSRIIFVFYVFLFTFVSSTFSIYAQNNNGWKKQLEEIRQNEILKDKKYPQLVSYKCCGKIETKSEVEKIKKQLLSYTDNYLPVFNKDNKSIELLNLEEIQKRESEEDIKVSVKLITDYLNHIIQPGMAIVQLTWRSHFKIYKSLCIVSDDTIVYDHVIMNLMPTKKEMK